MAKKPTARRGSAAAKNDALGNTSYPNARFSAAFDYNELSLTRAATQLWQPARKVFLGVASVALVVMVASLLIDENNLVPALVALPVAVVASALNTRWDRVQVRLARSTTLAVGPGGERRRVVVTDDAVHTESSTGTTATYPLSELRRVYAVDEFVVADFGSKRYVFVPRNALSENRFRELVRFLKEAVPTTA